MTNHAYIYDAVRTPRTKAKPEGGLHDLTPYDLLGSLYTALKERTGLNPKDVGDVIMGCVTQSGEQGGNVAKASTLHYPGWPSSVPGITINRYCSSGVDSINFAAMKVIAGLDELVIAGGVEMMSRVKMYSDNAAPFVDFKLSAKLGMFPMGNGADLLASLHGISREQADEIALLSQQRATHARDNGYFKSIVPVENEVKGVTIEQDENIRPSTSMESLAKLDPAFAALGEKGINAAYLAKHSDLDNVTHIHTAANSPAMSDGAAAVLVGSLEAGKKLSIKPRARIVEMVTVSDELDTVITGCVLAVKEVLKRQNLQASDVDLFEIHESFAATMVYAQSELGIDIDKLNVNGGCIALGHPLGATGSMMTGTLLDELERRGLKTGIVSAAGAAGAGTAMMIELV